MTLTRPGSIGSTQCDPCCTTRAIRELVRRSSDHGRSIGALEAGRRRRAFPRGEPGGIGRLGFDMSQLAHLGDVLGMNARLFPDKIGARDLERAHDLPRSGTSAPAGSPTRCPASGSRRATASACSPTTASSGWRSTSRRRRPGWSRCRSTSGSSGRRSHYIVENCEARASSCRTTARRGRGDPRAICRCRPAASSTSAARTPAGYRGYEDADRQRAATREPARRGERRRPLGADVHLGHHRQAEGRHPQPPRQRAAVARDRGRDGLRPRDDTALLVMPMCHANSLYFFGAFTYLRRRLRRSTTARASIPSTCCARWPTSGATFTSLVPTHYIMMLGLPDAVRGSATTSSAVTQADDLVGAGARATPSSRSWSISGTPACSSSTARPRPAGSRMLQPGRAVRPSSARSAANASARGRSGCSIRDGNEVPDGEVGELYSCNALHVRRLLEAAREDRGGVPRRLLHGRRHGAPRRGRLHPPRRPQEQHDHLAAARTSIRPRSRALLGAHPEGEGRRGRSACPTRNGASACTRWSCCTTAQRRPRPRLLDWCRDRIAGYKRPRSISFIREDEMPRTATGKILHRVLRTQLRDAGG